MVGDACTDDTADVVASFGDARIQYHALAVNVGEQSGPNNHGVSRSCGELVAFLNHDDLCCRTISSGWAFPSGFRAGSYRNRDEIDNGVYAERIRIEPGFREQLLTEIVLGQARGGGIADSTTAVLPYLSRAVKNALKTVLSAVGVPAVIVNMPDRAYDYDNPDHWRLPPTTRQIPYTFQAPARQSSL